MDIRELFDQNPWWKDKGAIGQDYSIQNWQGRKYHWRPRLLDEISLAPFALHILSGPRQSGKTTALKLLIQELLGTREPKSIFFFNCENLADYKELGEALTLYLEFKESNGIKQAIIMLDEITSPREWYRAVKSLIDRGKVRDDVVILTGSSSIEVRGETELFPGRRGHGKDLVLHPLSFREFVGVVDPGLMGKIAPMHSMKELARKAPNALLFEKELGKHIGAYMTHGGFPLSVADFPGSREDAKRAYLSWIKNAVLKAERSDVVARQVMKVVVETQQSAVSWEGISKKIEIKSPKTVAAYLELLQSIFAVTIQYNLDISGKKIRFGKNKKVHLRDPLLMEVFEEWCLVRAQDRQSALAESILVEHLIRLFPEKVFFWKDGYEVDAVVLEDGKLLGFEMKWSERADAKAPKQLSSFVIVTRNEYAEKPLKIPLGVFLSMLDI